MICFQVATLGCLSSGYAFTGVSYCLFLPSPLRQGVRHCRLQNVFGPARFCVCAIFWYQSHPVVTSVALERTESCFGIWRQTDLIHMAKTFQSPHRGSAAERGGFGLCIVQGASCPLCWGSCPAAFEHGVPPALNVGRA